MEGGKTADTAEQGVGGHQPGGRQAKQQSSQPSHRVERWAKGTQLNLFSSLAYLFSSWSF